MGLNSAAAINYLLETMLNSHICDCDCKNCYYCVYKDKELICSIDHVKTGIGSFEDHEYTMPC